MPAPAILAIDQGTTNTKALLLNGDGVIVAQGTAPVPIVHPKSGWVEQDAEAIWQSVINAVSVCCASAGDKHFSNRDFQPARVRGSLGSRYRSSPRPGHHLAMPQDRTCFGKVESI